MVLLIFWSRLLSFLINMHIRKASVPDIALVAEFNLALAAETENLRLDPGCVAAGVGALLQDATKGVYFVAEREGKIIGQVMITYEWSDWRNGNIWWLQSVYVRPDCRGQGVFAALFNHVRKLAGQDEHVCGLRLYMHEANQRARCSYERLGMRQTEYLVFELNLRAGAGSG